MTIFIESHFNCFTIILQFPVLAFRPNIPLCLQKFRTEHGAAGRAADGVVGKTHKYIGGEEEKSEKEPLRVLGTCEDGEIKVPSEIPHRARSRRPRRGRCCGKDPQTSSHRHDPPGDKNEEKRQPEQETDQEYAESGNAGPEELETWRAAEQQEQEELPGGEDSESVPRPEPIRNGYMNDQLPYVSLLIKAHTQVTQIF